MTARRQLLPRLGPLLAPLVWGSVLARLLGLVAGVVLASLSWLASPAAAHTDLVSTSPKEGARLDAAPADIRLDFSEDMSADLSAVTLSVEDGGVLPMSVRAGASSTMLVAEVPADAITASATTTRWRVSYRVVSRDGHPVTGEVRFEVRPSQPSASPSASPSTSPSTSPPTPPSTSPSTSPSTPVPTAGAGDASGPASQSEGPSGWGLVIGVAVVLLVLVVLAVAAGIRLARRGPVQ